MTSNKTKAKRATKKTAKVVATNPGTSTASVGAIVTIIGRYVGWDDQTSLDVATLFLFLSPAVKALATWYADYKARKAETAEE